MARGLVKDSDKNNYKTAKAKTPIHPTQKTFRKRFEVIHLQKKSSFDWQVLIAKVLGRKTASETEEGRQTSKMM